MMFEIFCALIICVAGYGIWKHGYYCGTELSETELLRLLAQYRHLDAQYQKLSTPDLKTQASKVIATAEAEIEALRSRS